MPVPPQFNINKNMVQLENHNQKDLNIQDYTHSSLALHPSPLIDRPMHPPGTTGIAKVPDGGRPLELPLTKCLCIMPLVISFKWFIPHYIYIYYIYIYINIPIFYTRSPPLGSPIYPLPSESPHGSDTTQGSGAISSPGTGTSTAAVSVSTVCKVSGTGSTAAASCPAAISARQLPLSGT